MLFSRFKAGGQAPRTTPIAGGPAPRTPRDIFSQMKGGPDV